MATTRTPEEKKAFLTYVKYLQSVVELRDIKAKVQRSKERRKALTREYIDAIANTLNEAKDLKCRAAHVKELMAQKGDLENMNVHGNISHVITSVDQQNKKHAEAGYVAIRTVKPVDKETLYSEMNVLNEQDEPHDKLTLDKAELKIIAAVHKGLEDLKRIRELKKEIAESCDKLEFLKSVQHLLNDGTSDSDYGSAHEPEAYDVSSSEDTSESSC
uniref:Uncharacterized protein n=1 Tax=Rhipicephalus zambeziensis TaxID=60191 RepID=A0A224YK94_9ACAR